MFLIYLIIFIALALAILIGSHYLLYLSVVNFFSINDPTQNNVLLVALMFLSVCFILATILTMLKENSFTRRVYFLSGFWMGFFVNLFAATIFIWIILDIVRPFGPDLKPLFPSLTLFALALIYSLYGVWNARHPKLKNINVNIPNLPDSWKGKKIIQLSDIHIGHVNRSEFVAEIIRKVNLQNAEAVFITGDIFDGMDGDLDSPIKLINNLETKKGVFFITGNHETYLGTDQVNKNLSKTKAVILNDQVIDIDGLRLIGINYPDRNEKKDMIKVLESLRSEFQNQPNILLYHSPVNIKKIRDLGINLELCGHTHRGQIFPINFITKLLFKGYDYGLYKMGSYTLYVTSGTGSWGPPMRTGSVPEIVVITLN